MNLKMTTQIALITTISFFAATTHAATVSDVYKKVLDARTYASQAKNIGKNIQTKIDGAITNKLDILQSTINEIPARLDALPDPVAILGDSKEVIEDSVSQITGELNRMKDDFNEFKGNGCDVSSVCGAMKNKLLGIYSGISSIQAKLPAYSVLPMPSSSFIDPNELAIQNMPPIALFGISTVTGPLDTLDSLESISDWVDQLRFYSFDPISETSDYRLPLEECQALEDSISSDNWVFNNMDDLIGKVELVTHILSEVLPKDIVINAWVGTSIPNPALPVAVLMNKVSVDFQSLLENEHAQRKSQVSTCRTQAYRTMMLSAIGQ